MLVVSGKFTRFALAAKSATFTVSILAINVSNSGRDASIFGRVLHVRFNFQPVRCSIYRYLELQPGAGRNLQSEFFQFIPVKGRRFSMNLANRANLANCAINIRMIERLREVSATKNNRKEILWCRREIYSFNGRRQPFSKCQVQSDRT